MSHKKAFLIILDGWGHGKIAETDAIQQANTPFVDSLYKEYPNAELTTSGSEVGLPEGQMGNSEVGHLNIGAGRVVFQELARINNEIKEGHFFNNPVLIQAIDYAELKGKQVHLLGLLSDGGVHSHLNHLIAFADIFKERMIPCSIHAFLDGRDTAPEGGATYLQTLQQAIEGGPVHISSVIGRYYAMDRDNRWERIKKAYDLLVKGQGEHHKDPIEAVNGEYLKGITDEFMTGLKLDSSTIEEGDVVIFANFRTDRPRELTRALSQNDFLDHGMSMLNLHFVTMTEYDAEFKGVKVMYEKENIDKTLGQIISENGLTQLRVAETEKYPHVTFFFNGGREEAFPGEKRTMAPSPKVATYDLQPEMSAEEVCQKTIEAIKDDQPDFICLNFANTDMVGHTGVMKAAIKAAETVDSCLSSLVPCALSHDYRIIVIADHGNADIMANPDGSPHTAHTTNPVPIIVLSPDKHVKRVDPGKLADIAPSLLHLMGIEIPTEMTGKVLVQ